MLNQIKAVLRHPGTAVRALAYRLFSATHCKVARGSNYDHPFSLQSVTDVGQTVVQLSNSTQNHFPSVIDILQLLLLDYFKLSEVPLPFLLERKIISIFSRVKHFLFVRN